MNETLQKTISEQLCSAIRAADKSRFEISEETGLTQSAISRFVNGKCGLSLRSVDSICECLGVEFEISKIQRKTGE